MLSVRAKVKTPPAGIFGYASNEQQKLRLTQRRGARGVRVQATEHPLAGSNKAGSQDEERKKTAACGRWANVEKCRTWRRGAAGWGALSCTRPRLSAPQHHHSTAGGARDPRPPARGSAPPARRPTAAPRSSPGPRALSGGCPAPTAAGSRPPPQTAPGPGG